MGSLVSHGFQDTAVLPHSVESDWETSHSFTVSKTLLTEQKVQKSSVCPVPYHPQWICSESNGNKEM